MRQYLDMLNNVLENGVPKQPVRFNSDGVPIPVSNGTIGTFAEIFRHDMSKGFPLLTTKKMAWKPIRVELEGFIKGITDKKWYQDRGCRIWDEWHNPKSNDTNDLGPIYGYQWRKFCEHFGDWSIWEVGEPNAGGEYQMATNRNGISSGADQLKLIVNNLRTNPYDRRMVCSAWNPNQIDMMALPPCHFSWNVVVYGNKLNLIWHQRSCDLFLGVPFNIASYALLLLLLAKEGGLEPGELVGTLNDCHLYENQIEQAKLQLTRVPSVLPAVSLNPDKNIFDWTYEDVIIENYVASPSIKSDVTV